MKTLLKIANLTKRYGSRTILDNLDFQLNEGEFASIVGASGAGKSTLMNIIGLLEEYNEGAYTFKEKKIVTELDKSLVRRNEIGYIFQAFHLLPTLTAKENIFLPFHYNHKKGADFEDLSERLQIQHLLDQFPDQLSGGEKQRVAIARALIIEPTLLLADEPTGNLDLKNRDIVLQILKEEHKKGKAVLLITHDPQAAQVAETRYRLDKGALHEY